MDIDILKPDTGKMHIERPSHSASASAVESPEVATPEPERRPYTEPVSEGEEDDEYAVAPAPDEVKASGLSGEAVAEASGRTSDRRERSCTVDKFNAALVARNRTTHQEECR